MRLSPIDHVFTGEQGYSIEFLYFYQKRLAIKLLRTSLKNASRKFYPLTQILEERDDTYYLIDGKGVDIEFIDCTDKDMPSTTDLAALYPHYLPLRSTPGNPLFRAQLSHFKNGSTLAVNISHCLVDGFSYFMFMSYWAGLARTPLANVFDYLKLKLFQPQFDRSLLCPSDLPKSVSKMDLRKKAGCIVGAERSFGDFKQNKFEIVRYKKIEIQEELARANSQSQVTLSANDLITVKLLREFAKKWNSANDVLYVTTAFDYRRVHRDLKRFYFGNAVLGIHTQINFKDLYNKEIWQLSEMIRSATSSINQERAVDSLRYLEKYRLENGTKSMANIHVSHPEKGFLITNLTRMPVASLDFGAGAPLQIVPMTMAPRVFIVMSDRKDYIVRVSV
jgi:hypothetical protein